MNNIYKTFPKDRQNFLHAVKPKMQFLPKIGIWVCSNNLYIRGEGNTPREAYNLWKSRFLTFTRLPRKGHWNKQSVMQWVQAGCPTIRSYIGNKLIVGYDALTDELVLQGY